MLRILSVSLLFFCLSFSWGDDLQEDFRKADEQIEDLKKIIQPEPNLQWNRYVTANFEILSIDDAQGRYLSENVEFIKTWILWRWGLPDVVFKSKCKVICVPSRDVYEQLFNSKSSFSKDKTVWMITEGRDWHVRLPTYLTEAVLVNLEENHSSRLPFWLHRGTAILNGKVSDVKNSVLTSRDFDTKKVLTTDASVYKSMKVEDKEVYDSSAALFCLFMRDKLLLEFVGAAMVDPERAIVRLGFKDYQECNGVVIKYLEGIRNSTDNFFAWSVKGK